MSAPLFAATSYSSSNHLPACCRKDGAHHCAALVAESGNTAERYASAPAEHCPYFPHAILPANLQVHIFTLPAGGLPSIAAGSYRLSTISDKSQLIVSFDRAQQKRGPPSLHSILFS
ncbi:MAG TPA: hypothetical protein VHB45_08480 [Alloacidobacterium sp.]|nr:hypothetical protein [Alloacidobacterium sp.]